MTVATVLANLMNKVDVVWSVDDRLVLDAIRRSNKSLADASLSEIGDHLWGMDADQMRGFASNVKGIFHELKFVKQYNDNHGDLVARVYEKTNHPGGDVVFSRGGIDVGQLQLKAGASEELVREHLERYPHIPVHATSEIAARAGVPSSGFGNADLDHSVSSSLSDVVGQGHADQLVNAAEVSGLVAGAMGVAKVLGGKESTAVATRTALRDIGVAVSSTMLVDLIF